MFEYDNEVMAAAEELDKYDFTEILRSCYDNGVRDFWDIYDKILEKHKELEDVDGAFDKMSSDEIMEYLNDRYDVKFDEVITHRMRYRWNYKR